MKRTANAEHIQGLGHLAFVNRLAAINRGVQDIDAICKQNTSDCGQQARNVVRNQHHLGILASGVMDKVHSTRPFAFAQQAGLLSDSKNRVFDEVPLRQARKQRLHLLFGHVLRQLRFGFAFAVAHSLLHLL
jgi:capsid protein